MRDAPIEEFADEVCDAMEALSSDERLPHAEREAFRHNLLTLLSADIFSLLTKVHDLATEDERTFCHARIITDLRPVFGLDPDDGPKAMLVVHMLKLTYHQGTKEHKHFHVSLDSADLKAMKQLIQRAELKAKTLKRSVQGFRTFGVPEE